VGVRVGLPRGGARAAVLVVRTVHDVHAQVHQHERVQPRLGEHELLEGLLDVRGDGQCSVGSELGPTFLWPHLLAMLTLTLTLTPNP
jgi:hypothetical protein